MAHERVRLQPNALAYPLTTQFSTKLVGLGGFEPPMTEPKPVVLPLHHSPIIGASLHTRLSNVPTLYYETSPLLLLTPIASKYSKLILYLQHL